MDVGVTPEDLTERFEIFASAGLIDRRGSVVFAAAGGRKGEREHEERSKEGTEHRGNLTEAADIAIDELDLDFARENKTHRALHEDAVPGRRDGNEERSAREMNAELLVSLGATGFNRGNRGRAGAGSAGLGPAGSTFENVQTHAAPVSL
jgi:hypothetical protein